MASQRMNVDNDVNGNISVVNGTTSGRNVYAQQVASDRHYVTVQRWEEDERMKMYCKDYVKIGKWNIITLYQPGKYENIKQEFGRLKVDVMGLSEVRWEGTDKDITFIYSDGETHQRGVGVMMTANAAKSIAGYWAISDRIILVKLTGTQIDVNLIQVYAPTCDYTDEDIEDFYETLTAAKKLCKQHEIILQKLGREDMRILCKTYPGADGGHGCDHVPVIATMKLRLKNIKKKRKQPKKALQVLSNSEFKERYTVQDVLARWVEYVGELYDDERGMKPEYEGELEGPELM
ncbi:craniofacial development protein 2-like [Penaeus japonicus]|uniref:craniofacial development protein 2-like n=1 Tax=Penaeus japonicus TaxID=27405 RepID=UPI001C714F2A|nr:craniofacial development protein 2-like [Penaeus japonicus]